MRNRSNRVEGLLLETVSELLRLEFKDPRLEQITVTHAQVSRDLSHATVYVAAFGDDARRDAAVPVLQKLAGRIGGEFARRGRLRVAPEIRFSPDTGLDEGDKVMQLLRELETQA